MLKVVLQQLLKLLYWLQAPEMLQLVQKLKQALVLHKQQQALVMLKVVLQQLLKLLYWLQAPEMLQLVQKLKQALVLQVPQ
jgi:hypothetical protein